MAPFELVILIALFIDCVLTCYCAAVQKPISGIFGVLAGFGFLWLLGVPVVTYAHDNWKNLIVFFLVYVVVGVPWSLYKWWRFAVHAKQDFQEMLLEHPFPLRGVTPLKGTSEYEDVNRYPQHPVVISKDESDRDYYGRMAVHMMRWGKKSEIELNALTGKFELPPSHHKGRILTWLSLWPFSVIATALDTLIIRLWENIYRFFSESFQRISKFVLSDLNP